MPLLCVDGSVWIGVESLLGLGTHNRGEESSDAISHVRYLTISMMIDIVYRVQRVVS